VTGPGGEPWEIYTVLADAGAELAGKTQLDVAGVSAAASGGGCCGTAGSFAEDRAATTGVCCAG